MAANGTYNQQDQRGQVPIFSDPRDTEIAPCIAVNPARRFGKPTLAGTRITVAEVLSKLKAGWTIDEILHAWPHLTREQIIQALDYADQQGASLSDLRQSAASHIRALSML